MRDGTSIRVSVNSPAFEGETLPTWIGSLKGPPAVLDSSAVVHQSENGERSIRIAVVNRSETESYTVALRIAFENVAEDVEVHELWHADVKAKNGWGGHRGCGQNCNLFAEVLVLYVCGSSLVLIAYLSGALAKIKFTFNKSVRMTSFH